MKDSNNPKIKRKDPEIDSEEYGKRPRPTGKGRERVVHEKIIAKRLGGGTPPTMDANMRALEQWNKLPGSIVHPPTDVRLQPTQELTKPPKARSSVPPSHDDAADKED